MKQTKKPNPLFFSYDFEKLFKGPEGAQRMEEIRAQKQSVKHAIRAGAPKETYQKLGILLSGYEAIEKLAKSIQKRI